MFIDKLGSCSVCKRNVEEFGSTCGLLDCPHTQEGVERVENNVIKEEFGVDVNRIKVEIEKAKRGDNITVKEEGEPQKNIGVDTAALEHPVHGVPEANPQPKEESPKQEGEAEKTWGTKK